MFSPSGATRSRQRSADAYLAELRKKYGVELDDSAKAALRPNRQPAWRQNDRGSLDRSPVAPRPIEVVLAAR